MQDPREAGPSGGASIEVLCEDCGERTTFPAAQRGSVQECPHCGTYLDVGEEPAGDSPPPDEEAVTDPLSEEELVALLDRLIQTKMVTALSEEEWTRLAYTLPDCDWGTAGWAIAKRWSGEELARRIRSGELGRDPEYRTWTEDTFESEAE